MKRLLSLDIKYSLTQILYFGGFCGLMGYASVYLLDRGVSNSVIGMVLALISVISVFAQPMIASYADKNKQIELRTIIAYILVAAIILSFIIYFYKGMVPILLCLFVGISTLMITLQPLLNSLAFVFEKYGITVNYGVARGLGSAAYAIVSITLGYMVEDFGASIIPLVYIAFNIMLIIVVYVYVIPKTEQKEISIDSREEANNNELSFIDFCRTYKKFMIFILGVVAVFFTHTIINNFFIQVIKPIGGTSHEMGTAVFLAAILELPAMSLFNTVRKRVNCTTLIKISVIMFAVKHILTFLATGMVMIYIAQVFQMGAYAIFIPASVYYVNEIIDKRDSIKGQSMVTMAITGSGIIANLLGGILLDLVGVKYVLLIGSVVSVLGAFIVIAAVKNNKVIE
ncbi:MULTISPECIES: MFS transporter [Clostridium]|uniref:MFS transporter n=1 Tax=Clostridium TaxID=1485 RepID=UPI0008266BF4|nr:MULTISPECIES: MFS transporter [Clostridium]PJI10456.1 MFS transporter [Clostridium sp. CT7]